MNKILFFISVLFIGFSFACGNQGSNESQQPQFGSIGGFGGPR